MASNSTRLNIGRLQGLMGFVPALVLIIGLAYGAAYAFFVPQPGFEFSTLWVVLLEPDCSTPSGWCESNPGPWSRVIRSCRSVI